ncbi:MAG: HD domain-containing protein [Thermoproteota archaeon]
MELGSRKDSRCSRESVVRLLVREAPDRELALHSLLVARVSERLAAAEGKDTLVAYLAGLLHDVGKMEARKRGAREEEVSAEMASRILTEAGCAPSLVERVTSALKGEGGVADVVLDADTLVKLGPASILEVGVKYGLRGETLVEAILSGLSRQLTVIENIDRVLCTDTARKEAKRLAEETRKLVSSVLEDMRRLGLELAVGRIGVGDRVYVLIKASRCPVCRSALEEECGSTGPFCAGVRLKLTCRKCGWFSYVSSCIPERHCAR